MTKEQLQNALNEATARIDEQKAKIANLETENAKLKADLLDAIPATASATFAVDKDRIALLEAENGRITAELAAAKKRIEATAGANAILEDELKEARAQQQQPAGDPADKGKIGILLGAIGKSCADHCPHHLDEAACKNCSVFKAVFSAGYQIPRPEPAQEV